MRFAAPGTLMDARKERVANFDAFGNTTGYQPAHEPLTAFHNSKHACSALPESLCTSAI